MSESTADSALAQRLRADGGLLASALVGRPVERDAPIEGVPQRLALAVAAIREGYLLHYGRPRLFEFGADVDAALLAGDHLYALGLAELAEIGDLAAVRAMAAVIDQSAVAHAAGDSDAAAHAWELGVRKLAADG
jgi:hypothetical protein